MTSAGADGSVSIALEEPVEGAVVAGRFTVRGRLVGAADDVGLLRVHGQDVARKDGQFQVELAASSEGLLRIRILHAEIGRPAMTLERQVVVDWSPPVIDVRQPAEPESVHTDGDVQIQGVVRDPHFAELRMNGAAVKVGPGGEFDATFLLPAEGEVRVVLTALDRAGNRAEVARLMRARAAPPGPAPATAPAVPAPTGPVVLTLGGGESVTLEDGAERSVAEGYGASAKLTADALASLEAALGAVAWAPKQAERRAPGPPRPLVVRASAEVGWERIEPLVRLGFSPSVARLAVLVRTAAGAEGRIVAPRRPGEAGPRMAIGLQGGAAAPGQDTATRIDVVTPPILLPRATGPSTNLQRETALRRLREEIARRIRAEPGIVGELVVAAGAAAVPCGDVVSVLQECSRVGLLRVALAPAASTPAPGTARPLARLPSGAVAAGPSKVPAPTAPSSPPASPSSPATSAPTPDPAALLEAALAQPLPARDWPKVQDKTLMSRLDRLQGATRGRTLEADRSVAEALLWLAAHQSADGSWSSDGFGRICDGATTTQPPVEGAGESGYDTGVTAIALCAYLAAGHTHRRPGPFARTLARGLSWLRTRQDGQGCISTRTRPRWMYEHAWGYLALLEAYGLAGDAALLEPCGRARDFCMQARNPGAGWGYGVKTGTSDVFLTLLMDQCHETSRNLSNAAIGVDDALYPALAWQQSAEQQLEPGDWVMERLDPRSGRLGYDGRGGGPYRPEDRAGLFPATRSASLTAAHLAMEVIRGFTDEEYKASFELLRRLPPRWSPEEGTIDFFYWAYGSAALTTLGHPAWKTWNAALHKDVLPHQRSDGGWCGYRGSWDPVDAFGREGGRVVSTALMAMVFASYDRYALDF